MIENVINLTSLFKTENGESLILSPGQRQIADIIIQRKPSRNWLSCITQYGKSLTVGLATLIRAITFPEKWCIIGATESKTRIIMNYVIGHIFDHSLFESQLELSGESSFESLKRERSKNRLTFKRGGEIFILSAQAGNSKAVLDALTGFGSQNIILDDSPLIPDPLYAMVKRMLGGYKDNFLLEIGNPFYRNHFLKAYQNPRYNKIKIDYMQAIEEGRVTKEFIDEMRSEAFFDILYGCKFPDAEDFDEKGWRPLFSDLFLQTRMVKVDTIEGRCRLGVDIGGGTAFNVFALRGKDRARIIQKDQNPDTMVTVGNIRQLMLENKILPEDVFIDDTGIGHGVSDRLHEVGIMVNRVVVGESALEKDKYINIRAEMYWQLKEWLKNGGVLDKNNDFLQLLDIKYKIQSDRKIKLMSKGEMKDNGVLSPDVADALALTFCEPAEPEPYEEGYDTEDSVEEEEMVYA